MVWPYLGTCAASPNPKRDSVREPGAGLRFALANPGLTFGTPLAFTQEFTPWTAILGIAIPGFSAAPPVPQATAAQPQIPPSPLTAPTGPKDLPPIHPRGVHAESPRAWQSPVPGWRPPLEPSTFRSRC